MTAIKRRYILLTLFFAILPWQKVFAQEDPPSLDKTIEWLRQYVTNSIVMNQQLSDKKSSKKQVIEWSLANPSRCTLIWKGWKLEDNAGRSSFASVEINLADFDPRKITTGNYNISTPKHTDRYWVVFLETTDKKNTVNWRSVNGSFYSPFVSFRFDDEDVAQGVVRALNHAVNLCGGKSSIDKPDPFIRRKQPIRRPRL